MLPPGRIPFPFFSLCASLWVLPLKPKKQSVKNIGKPEPARASGQKDSTSPSSELGSKKISGKKVWLFRFLALSLPLIFLLFGIELVLRLVGYGYPTTFFVPQEINGVRFLVDNPHFAERFFPKSMARTPSPVRMTAVKSPGTIRIFIFGESAALGDPEPAFGFGRYLEVLLQMRFPTNRFEVIVAAITAINSHALLPMAEECAKYEGDLWILYIGNNEVVGPFGAGTVSDREPRRFGSFAPPWH